MAEQVKKDLSAQLENRPGRRDLVQRNIIKSYNADPKLQGVMQALTKTQAGNRLNRLLEQRRSVTELQNKNIIPITVGKHGTNVQIAHRQILKQQDKDKLNSFLEHRPSLQDIANQNVFEDTMTWTRAFTTGTIPVPRNCHTMTTLKKKLYLFGGVAGQYAIRANEVLVYDTETMIWSRPMIGGVMPSERYSHTCVSIGSQLVLFGGYAINHNIWENNIHVLDTEFVQVFTPPLGRKAKSQQMLMWYEPEISGALPPRRAAHSAICLDKKMYIFGGNDGKLFFNDVWVIDLSQDNLRWERAECKGDVPVPRAGHTATLFKGKAGPVMVVFGGVSEKGPLNDVLVLDLNTMVWKNLMVTGTAPTPRAGHTATLVYKSCLLVFGGGHMDRFFNDLHLLNIDTATWSRPSDSGIVPVPRVGHTCNSVENKLYIFGGGDANDTFNDMHILDTVFLLLPREEEAESLDSASPHVSVSEETIQAILGSMSSVKTEIENSIHNTRAQIHAAHAEQVHAENHLLSIFETLQQTRADTFDALKQQVERLQQTVQTQMRDLRDTFTQALALSQRRHSQTYSDTTPPGVHRTKSQDSSVSSEAASPTARDDTMEIPAPGTGKHYKKRKRRKEKARQGKLLLQQQNLTGKVPESPQLKVNAGTVAAKPKAPALKLPVSDRPGPISYAGAAKAGSPMVGKPPAILKPDDSKEAETAVSPTATSNGVKLENGWQTQHRKKRGGTRAK